jgi:hypothetical protein
MNHPFTTWFGRSRLAAHLGYRPDEPLHFLNQRLCGLWLIWIGMVIMLAALFGGAFLIHPLIFGLGYVGGMALIFGTPAVERRLSYGPETRFQANMGRLAIVLMFVLMTLIAGRAFATLDYRTIWLGALLATALHFIPFAFVHGPAMLWLALPLTLIALAGFALPELPLLVIALLDGGVKLSFGIALLRSGRPETVYLSGGANGTDRSYQPAGADRPGGLPGGRPGPGRH